ncbi:hypothetical protein H072_7919 [Dactylellina haptotyla CBS 200.50]|uniref:Phospholipid/glycerol acyltransferase domain-containing protein n=1 Tax=Dactylellina haptotyla (strain CBS 200.50) TaxID=1284197 RepID=S8A668_DACHA|nr:hypothetical protein H072_7919 [Dactylellina haptotyla CBS 200.50]
MEALFLVTKNYNGDITCERQPPPPPSFPTLTHHHRRSNGSVELDARPQRTDGRRRPSAGWRRTGIAPFIPIATPTSAFHLPLAAVLFALRAPVLAAMTASYFLFLQFMPLGSLFQKGILWICMLVAGVFWVDLQVEGVKRGTLSRYPDRLPSPGSIIASTFSSPLDAMYLAATFDPIFLVPSFDTPYVFQLTLLQTIFYTFTPPTSKPYSTKPTTIAEVVAKNPHRIIVIFPEGTTSNGRALLRFAPAFDSFATQYKSSGENGHGNGKIPKNLIFPISLRYLPSATTTPLPGSYGVFLWRLLGQPSQTIKVRIGEAVRIGELEKSTDSLATTSSSETITEKTIVRSPEDSAARVPRVGALEEKVGEILVRVGRIRRVGLGVKEKIGFWNAWKSQGRKKK